MQKVLLTGVTGFLGSHTTLQLLNKGYQVTGTLRNLDRADDIKKVITQHTNHIQNLRLEEANLMSDQDVWNRLCQGHDYVLHIASPFPRELPKHEDDLIIPAKKGVLNVLTAAAKAKVRRVVLTSSSGAIVYGKPKHQRRAIFTESDWTDVKNLKDTAPYFRSKTLAERAAWDFMEKDDSGLELTTICPGAILGPVLEKDYGTSANMVIKILDGSSPAIPRIGFDVVDVRSVADLHIKAMENPAAAGERFIGSSGFLSFKEMADLLRKAYPDRKIPKIMLPDFAVKLFAQFEKTVKPILIDLNAERRVDHSKAVNLLGWQPISNEKAVLDCAKSVIEQGLV